MVEKLARWKRQIAKVALFLKERGHFCGTGYSYEEIIGHWWSSMELETSSWTTKKAIRGKKMKYECKLTSNIKEDRKNFLTIRTERKGWPVCWWFILHCREFIQSLSSLHVRNLFSTYKLCGSLQSLERRRTGAQIFKQMGN